MFDNTIDPGKIHRLFTLETDHFYVFSKFDDILWQDGRRMTN